MAIGGNFLTHNKILPAAYINFVSKSRALGSLSDRGIVSIAMKINWGIEDKVFTLYSSDFEKKAIEIFGYSYQSEQLKPIREIFKNAKEIKFFRLGKGTKANAAIGQLTINANYSGSRGNNIKIKISNNLGKGSFTVFTYIGENLVDEQIIYNIQDLKTNAFVTFSGTGNITANSGTNLSGGTDIEVTNQEYSNFLESIESETFNTLIYDGDDDITKGLFDSFTKRLRDDEGVKIVTVLHNYTKANYEGVVSLKNDKRLIYWLAGALAGAEINESITNKTYDGEYEVDAKFSNAILKESVENGEIVFYYDLGNIKILKDINTFTDFSHNKNSDFSNNQVIRVLDSTANDIARIFKDYYLGKVQNDDLGRNIFKAEIIDYFNQLKSIRAIDNFDEKDIKISKGTEKGDVILDVIIEPVSCMDKLYMKCVIE